MTTILRTAEPRDLAGVVSLIGELAAFERLSHQVEITPERLALHLFGERPVIECIVAEAEQELVGFALFFTSYSTFLGKPGLYLEDLFVKQARRGEGLGRRLLTALAQIAVARDYGRFEWSVLDWNQGAIGFYRKLGADLLTEWQVCRLTGEPLRALAEGGTQQREG